MDSSDSFLYHLTAAIGGITVEAPSAFSIVAIILAIAFFLLSGFISATEIAFHSLTPSDINTLDEKRHPSDKRINRLLDEYDRLMATAQVANCIANVVAIVLCNCFLLDVLHFESPVTSFVVQVCVNALLLLFIGELTPKMYAVQNPLSYCRFAIHGMSALCVVFYPLASVFVRANTFINKHAHRNHNISIDELSHALELTNQTELTEDNNMLEGIIRFGDETAKEVMTPRQDIVDLNIRTPFKDVLKCIVENVYSRIPVYAETKDNIKGILYIKDLLPHLNKNDNFHWQSLIRPAYFVPETKMIDDLLRDFQMNKIHIAIVVDEFGGTSGLITMEDIIEEIVGEIHDEYDEEEHTYTVLNDHSWAFEGKTSLSDFYKVTGVHEDAFDEVVGDADTLAGLVLELKGEFPALHEKVVFHNYEFEILEMDNRRILKIKFTIFPAEPCEE